MEEIRSLVERSQSGDLDAYGQLVLKFQDMAYGYGYSLLGDFHLAEDAAQEAFIEAYRNLGRLRDTAAFPGWFRQVVFSRCQRILRRKQTAAVSLAGRLQARDKEPSEMMAKAELKESVLAAIASLPQEERTTTTLFYINGYSQLEIAGFLEVPVTTVKNRLCTSRKRLKKRMMNMVEETLKDYAPDERFSRGIIEKLLGRPNLIEIEGHPVRQAWEAVRRALADYEVVQGNELEDQKTFAVAEDHTWDLAYRVQNKALRYQMTTVTISAIRGRTPPIRLLAAGRVFRPDREDATHSKVFHQVDGVCVQAGADVEAFKATCERAIRGLLPGAALEWRSHDYGLVSPGLSLFGSVASGKHEILGGGVLKPSTLHNAGFDPHKVQGFAWGLCLERITMLAGNIDDIRKLRRPPFVPKHCGKSTARGG